MKSLGLKFRSENFLETSPYMVVRGCADHQQHTPLIEIFSRVYRDKGWFKKYRVEIFWGENFLEPSPYMVVCGCAAQYHHTQLIELKYDRD